MDDINNFNDIIKMTNDEFIEYVKNMQYEKLLEEYDGIIPTSFEDEHE